MSDRLVTGLVLLSGLGCGIIGGVFFAFSSFVMTALGKLPPAQGVAAMQSINIIVINPGFMVPFLGTGLLSLILLVGAVIGWGEARSGWVMAGAILYLAGCIAVTMGFNVPRNDTLATLDPTSGETASLWARYLVEWTFWNHVRAASSIAAAACLAIALKS